MADSILNENGKLVVDFSGQKRTQKALEGRSNLTEYANVDLASGYPANMIWTTKDGRRIALPNMSDSHLINTIFFIRRRTRQYRMQIATKILLNTLTAATLFDFVPNDVLDELSESSMMEIDKLKALPDEDFLRQAFPIYSKMLEEAYRRKLTIPNNDITKPSKPQHALEKMDDYDNEHMWGDS